MSAVGPFKAILSRLQFIIAERLPKPLARVFKPLIKQLVIGLFCGGHISAQTAINAIRRMGLVHS